MRYGSNKEVTVRVTYKDGRVVLFGNSYKKWQQQFVEYTYRKFGSKTEGWRYEDVAGVVTKLERSRNAWISFGGLKWCLESIFQDELNREGCQQHEPDNPRPRQYSEFVFEPHRLSVATRALKEY